MSLEEKFNAAVNVIRSLPKSGSYQPSNELMLRFYSYFKQATEGPCDKSKPGFWDVVNRAKWEAWNKLGNMTRDEAMKAYVEELHKIVETMSYSSDVASFLSVDDDEQGFPNTDLELVAGDVLAKVRSQRNTPSVSGASSPIRGSSPPPPRARHDSEDEYIDTVDSDQEAPPQTAPRLSNGHAHQITSQLTHLKVLEQLPGTLARLEADVAALRKAVEGERRALQVSTRFRSESVGAVAGHTGAARGGRGRAQEGGRRRAPRAADLKVLEQLPGTLARLEADVAALRKAVEGERRALQQVSGGWRWPWQELSPPTLLLLFVWPFIAYRIAARRANRNT